MVVVLGSNSGLFCGRSFLGVQSSVGLVDLGAVHYTWLVVINFFFLGVSVLEQHVGRVKLSRDLRRGLSPQNDLSFRRS